MNVLKADFRLAQDGDSDALGRLLQGECESARRFLTRKIPREHRSLLEADDILQQTCIDAFANFQKAGLQDTDALRRWFRTIANRHLISAIRSLKTLRRGGNRKPILQSGRSSLGVLLSHLQVFSATASRVAMNSESLNQLKDAIAKLPEHYREVIERYELGDESIDAVAKHLKRTVGAVFMIRTRAIQLLGQMLESNVH